MQKNNELTLYEEVMLLALRDEQGTVEMGAWYQQAVGGAVLAELFLAERVRLVRDGKKDLLECVRREPTGAELVDEWLQRIAADEKRRSVQHWVGKISSTKDLKGRIARGLARRGVLRVDEGKVLFLFTREVYPEVDPTPERELRERLRSSVLDPSAQPDARTGLLLSLAKGTGLIGLVFEKKERKHHKARIEAIVNGEACGQAARKLVEATNTAIFVACILPAVIT